MANWRDNLILVAPPIGDWRKQFTPVSTTSPIPEPPTSLSEQPPAPQSTEQEPDWRQQFEAAQKSEPEDRISINELTDIAAKHHVDPQTLIDMAPSLDVHVQGFPGSTSEQLQGFAGSSLGLGIPQKIEIATIKDPAVKAAADEMRQLWLQKEPASRVAAQIAPDIAVGLATLNPAELAGAARGAYKLATREGLEAAGKQLATREGATALGKAGLAGGAVGGVAGVGFSPTGEEVSGFAHGAATGIPLGIGLSGLIMGGSAASRTGRAVAPAEKAVSHEIERIAADPETGNQIEQKIADIRGPETELRKQDDQVFKTLLENPDALKVPETIQEIRKTAPGPATLQEYVNTQRDVRDFAKYLDGTPASGETPSLDDAIGTIAKRAERGDGPEFLKKQWDSYQDMRVAERELQDIAIRAEGDSYLKNQLRKTFQLGGAGRFVAQTIDTTRGTRLEPIIDKISQATKEFNILLNGAVRDSSKLEKMQKITGLDNDTLYEAVANPGSKQLAPKQQAVADYVRGVFDKYAATIRNYGVALPIRQDYIPRQRVAPEEYIRRMTQAADDIQARTGIDPRNLTPKGFERLKQDHSFGQFLDGAELGVEDKIDIRGQDAWQKANQAARTAMEPRARGNSLMHDIPSATKLREERVPEFLVERDVPKLVRNWSREMFKYATMRDGLQDLRRAEDLLVKTGDRDAAGYVHRLQQDLTGRRTTIPIALRKEGIRYKQQWIEKADEAKNPVAKETAELMGAVPEILQSMAANIHAAFLGFNPGSAMVNLMNPIMTTIPELGERYGTMKLLQGFGETYKTLALGRDIRLSPAMASSLGMKAGETINTRDISKIARNQSIASPQWSTELRQTMSQGMNNSRIYKWADRTNQAATNVAMLLFEGSENLIRSGVANAADRVAADFQKGVPGAIQFVKKMPPAQQRVMLAARDNPEQLASLMRNYLVNKTLLSYDKATMNEAGRYMGPIFSAFTKWPVETASDIVATYHRRGLSAGTKNLARRMILPYLAFAAFEKTQLPSAEESPTMRALGGKQGISRRSSPATTPLDLLNTKLVPPAAQPILHVATGAAHLDLTDMWKGLNEAIYIAGGPFTRGALFIQNDVPALFQGQEYKKGTLLNRLFPDLELDKQVKESTTREK